MSEQTMTSEKAALLKTKLPESQENNRSFEITAIDPLNPLFKETDFQRHSYFELIWIIYGHGEHFIDFETYNLDSQTIFFLYPGQLHKLIHKSSIKGYYIKFHEDFILDHPNLAEFFKLNSPPNFFNIKNPTEIKQIVENIEREYKNTDAGQRLLLQSYLTILLVKLSQHFQNKQPTITANSTVFTFKNLLEKEFIENKRVKDYAKKLYLTPNYLNDLVRESTGKSAGTWIKDRILLECKRLLVHTDSSVSQIAHDLQFEDPSYFCKFFKKSTNMTPQSWREELKQNPKWSKKKLSF